VKYTSGAAFRMALEERLRQESLSTGVPLVRLRKTVAFDRILARLAAGAGGSWVLKGNSGRWSPEAAGWLEASQHPVRAHELGG
jgi:hypothetical protein